ncbi:MAG: hypothetical protein LBC47_00050, partial [Tannerella sp.]|nr:hypothetical protein [Tannerella sp.]
MGIPKNFVKQFSAAGARLFAVRTMFSAFLRRMFVHTDFYRDSTSSNPLKNASTPSFSPNFHFFRLSGTILRSLINIMTGG